MLGDARLKVLPQSRMSRLAGLVDELKQGKAIKHDQHYAQSNAIQPYLFPAWIWMRRMRLRRRTGSLYTFPRDSTRYDAYCFTSSSYPLALSRYDSCTSMRIPLESKPSSEDLII